MSEGVLRPTTEQSFKDKGPVEVLKCDEMFKETRSMRISHKKNIDSHIRMYLLVQVMRFLCTLHSSKPL